MNEYSKMIWAQVDISALKETLLSFHLIYAICSKTEKVTIEVNS